MVAKKVETSEMLTVMVPCTVLVTTIVVVAGLGSTVVVPNTVVVGWTVVVVVLMNSGVEGVDEDSIVRDDSKLGTDATSVAVSVVWSVIVLVKVVLAGEGKASSDMDPVTASLLCSRY
jgi:hypothetical protein